MIWVPKAITWFRVVGVFEGQELQLVSWEWLFKAYEREQKQVFLNSQKGGYASCGDILKFLLQKGIANSREAKMVYTFQ
jgi:hypothetical protein